MPLEQLPGPSPTPTPIPTGAVLAATARLSAWADAVRDQSVTTVMTYNDAIILIEGMAEVLHSEE